LGIIERVSRFNNEVAPLKIVHRGLRADYGVGKGEYFVTDFGRKPSRLDQARPGRCEPEREQYKERQYLEKGAH
jgi:hypothetical protein